METKVSMVLLPHHENQVGTTGLPQQEHHPLAQNDSGQKYLPVSKCLRVTGRTIIQH